MKLSVVVIFHNMRREARRTLFSFSAAYQRDVDARDYEVIAIDNASTEPLDPAEVAACGPNFRYHFHDTDSVSPVAAMNLGAKMAQGDALAVVVDGARMASPGLVAHSLAAMRMDPAAFVCALSWHLGPDIQPKSTQAGYDQAVEDALLAEAEWQSDGYRLFEISTLAPSSGKGFFGDFPLECSWFCMARDRFVAVGGFNPAFRTPGGGLCNHDFRNRVLQEPGIVPVKLLGEGVFHQVHGGIATNAPPDRRPLAAYHAEYEAINGTCFTPVPVETPLYVGTLPPQARRFLG